MVEAFRSSTILSRMFASIMLSAIALAGLVTPASAQDATPVQLTARIQPAALPLTLALVPTELGFGSAPLGDTVIRDVEVRNTGQSPLFIQMVASSDPAEFAAGVSTCPASGLAPAITCRIAVTFAPNTLGARSATLTLTDNTAAGQQQVSLTGSGTVDLTITPASIALGNVKFGATVERSVALYNHEANSVSLSESFTGPNAGDFSIVGGSCGATLGAGNSCLIVVAFQPGALGGESATLAIADSPGSSSPHDVPITAGTIPESVSPLSLGFGEVPLNSSQTASTTVTNHAGATIALSDSIGGNNRGDFTVTGGTCSAALAGNSSCTIAVTFEPLATGVRIGTLSINVAQDPTSPIIVSLSGEGTPAKPTATATASATVSATRTATATATRTATKTATATATRTATATATHTATKTATPTATKTATATATPTLTATATATATRTATATATPTLTATATATATRTATATATPTLTATATPTITATATLSATPTVSATRTATSTPTATPTATGVVPTDVLTYHNDNGRTGQNLNEQILTTSNVKSSFGMLFHVSVDGLVDAEPLVKTQVSIPDNGVHNVLYVVTENDTVFAFDADDGSPLWSVSALGNGEVPSDDRGCGQVTPQIGITSTPVIDPSAGPNGTIYIVAMSKSTSGTYFQRIHALDITTGAEEFGGPVTVTASFPGVGASSNQGQVPFLPAQYKERAGLLLLNGTVYTTWASHCDAGNYTGWIIAYGVNNQGALAQTAVLNVTPNGSDGAMWGAGAGPAADSSGNIYFLDANGTFDTTLTALGFPDEGDYGNAFVKLSTTSGLQVSDYFTMFNTTYESDHDVDLGSGGALLLPDMVDSNGNTRHLAVGAGKDTNLYLVDRDNMGKFNPSNNSNAYQEMAGALPGGIWSMPAYFNNTLYYGSVGMQMQAFAFSNARLAANPSSVTPEYFGYPGTTPSISANGLNNAIVWAVENNGSGGVLHAYDAGNLANEFYNSGENPTAFADNKFVTPMIANGKVYVGTPNRVVVFGLTQ